MLKAFTSNSNRSTLQPTDLSLFPEGNSPGFGKVHVLLYGHSAALYFGPSEALHFDGVYDLLVIVVVVVEENVVVAVVEVSQERVSGIIDRPVGKMTSFDLSFFKFFLKENYKASSFLFFHENHLNVNKISFGRLWPPLASPAFPNVGASPA